MKDLKRFDGGMIRFYTEDGRRLAEASLGVPAFVPVDGESGLLTFKSTATSPVRVRGTGRIVRAYMCPLGNDTDIAGPFRCGLADDAAAAFRFASLDVEIGQQLNLGEFCVAIPNASDEAVAQFKAELEKTIKPKVKSSATVTRKAKRIKAWDSALDEDRTVKGYVARALRKIGTGDAARIQSVAEGIFGAKFSEDNVVLALNELYAAGVVENDDGPTVDSVGERSN